MPAHGHGEINTNADYVRIFAENKIITIWIRRIKMNTDGLYLDVSNRSKRRPAISTITLKPMVGNRIPVHSLARETGSRSGRWKILLTAVPTESKRILLNPRRTKSNFCRECQEWKSPNSTYRQPLSNQSSENAESCAVTTQSASIFTRQVDSMNKC